MVTQFHSSKNRLIGLEFSFSSRFVACNIKILMLLQFWQRVVRVLKKPALKNVVQ